jgi:DNA-binding beta-propeller fold protein YncE
VHGVAIDPQTRQVFVNDRNNHRIQVFDENGKFLRQWSTGGPPSDVHLVYMGADRRLWIFDRGTSKAVQYDVDGHLLYAWGTWGDMPGGFWGVHGVSVDQDGNFYSAAVDSGGGQKFIPRPGANPAMMVGKPVKGAW